MGIKIGFHGFLEDVIFLVPGIIRNELIETAPYPESVNVIDICNLLVV